MNKLEKHFIKLDNYTKRLENRSMKNITKGFKADLRAIKNILNDIYAEYEENGIVNLYEFEKYNRMTKLDVEIVRIINNRYKDIISETDGLLYNITNDNIKGILDIKEFAGIKLSIDVASIVNERTKGYSWADRYDKHRSDTIYKVQGAIKEGLDEGQTYHQVAKRLTRELAISIDDADRIVRTESHRCVNRAKLESLEEINREVPVNKKWITNLDGRERELHAELNGQVVAADDTFKISGYEAEAPGGFGVAHMDINCRCLMVIELNL